MHRFRKPLIWAVSIIIFLFIILFIAASVYINSFKPDFEKILSRQVGLETKIEGNISLKVMPGISFIVNDLKVIGNETYVLSIEQAEISVDYSGWLGLGSKIKAVKFISPQIFILRDASGNFNFKDENQQFLAEADDTGHALKLQNISIENGRFLYIDQKAGDSLLIEGFDIMTDLIYLAGTLDQIDINTVKALGTVAIERLQLNRMIMDSIRLKFDGQSGNFELMLADKNYFGGNMTGKAVFDFQESLTQITIAHQITGMQLGSFSASAGSPEFLSGVIDYKLDLGFESFDWARAKQSIHGTANITGSNIILRGAGIDSQLENFKKNRQINLAGLASVFVAGPLGAVLAKDIQLNSSDSISPHASDTLFISKLVSNWNIADGYAKAVDAAFATEKYRVAFTGNLLLSTQSYDKAGISLLYKNGCAALTQYFNGPFSAPETEIYKATGTITGPVDQFHQVLSNPHRFTCTPVYMGSLEHPLP